jgi:hypothetical protein
MEVLVWASITVIAIAFIVTVLVSWVGSIEIIKALRELFEKDDRK